MTSMTAELTTTIAPSLDQTAQITRGKQAKFAWKAWLKKGNNPSATQMAIYALLRGKSIAKTFTPITNSRKLSNGQYAWQGRDTAMRRALMLHESDWAPFEEMLAGAQKEPIKYRPGQSEYIAASSPLLMEMIALAKSSTTEGTEK